MEYIEVDIRLKEVVPFAEIIVARLHEFDFESYLENEEGISAYIQTHLFNEVVVNSVLNEIAKDTKLSFTINKVKQQNWNQQWESNFEPVTINEQCVIRADFHKPISGFNYEIVITPKMSFGTGHHETTSLIMNEMFNIDFNEKSVLDMGSGTGVLSILASKLGARSLIGIDCDEIAFENAKDNAILNNITNIDFLHADVNAIGETKYDIILANINRNVILNDITTYVYAMKEKAEVIFSGFLKEDISLILEKSEQLGLRLVVLKNKNKWQMLHLKKG